MTLHTLTSIIRGGGTVGASASVGRVTGPDPRWGVALAWARKSSGSTGRSGDITFYLDEPGLYRCRHIGEHDASIASQARRGGGRTFWLAVHPDGKAEEVGGEAMSPREALEAWTRLFPEQADHRGADHADPVTRAAEMDLALARPSVCDPRAAALRVYAGELYEMLADLVAWDEDQGGHNVPCWESARALLGRLRAKGA